MSDEPLYCPSCGVELGPEHNCNWNYESDTFPDRENRYCEVCGVIPKVGGECAFYDEFSNRWGCEV